jgi:hypothetical protein
MSRLAGESLLTVSGDVPAMPRTISEMSWMYERLPSRSVSVPGCSWWPVIAVVPFSRMMNVMSCPALIALEIASWPE